jgi:hypothetical protein
MKRRTEESSAILCMRVSDLPKPWVESAQENCADCKEPVWVSTRTRDSLPPSLPIICEQCAGERLKGYIG